MLILPASIADNPRPSGGKNFLQIKVNTILRTACSFRSLSDGHYVCLSSDCHSVKIDPLVTDNDIENALGYILKTAIMSDDQNNFAVYNHESQERLTEPKTSITHQRYGPSGFIVHFKATLLDGCNYLCGHAWTLAGVTIDFNFMDDHDLISGDPDKCKNA